MESSTSSSSSSSISIKDHVWGLADLDLEEGNGGERRGLMVPTSDAEVIKGDDGA
jgi:hypothetical protein